MLLDIPMERGFSITIDTELIVSVGPLNNCQEYKVTRRDGREYTIADDRFARESFLKAMKGEAGEPGPRTIRFGERGS